jgi:hypothetical protein
LFVSIEWTHSVFNQSPLHNGVAEINGEVFPAILQPIQQVAVERLGIGVCARFVPGVHDKQVVPRCFAASLQKLAQII